MLPASNIWFSCLRITLCPEAVSHLAAPASTLLLQQLEERGKCPDWKGTPEQQWLHVCYSVFHTPKSCRFGMLHKKKSCSKSGVALLWAKHMLSAVTLIKKLFWALKGLLCLQNINILLLLPICVAGKEPSRFIIMKKSHSFLFPQMQTAPSRSVSFPTPLGWLPCFCWFLGTFPPQSALPKPSDISVMWTRQPASRSGLTQFVAPT